MFILIIIILSPITASDPTNQNNFKAIKNKGINESFYNSWILRLSRPSRILCMTSCLTNSGCLVAMFNKKSEMIINCLLYDKFFTSSELISSESSTLYEKKKAISSTTTSYSYYSNSTRKPNMFKPLLHV